MASGRKRWLLVVGLAACSGEQTRYLELPELGAASGVVAIVHGPSSTEVAAFDPASDWRVETTFEEGESVTIDLLVYDCAFSSWITDPSEIGVARDAGRELPEPARVFSTSSDAGFEWNERDAVPGASASLSFVYTPPVRCGELEVENVVPFGLPEGTRLLIPIDETSVVAGTAEGNMYVVERGGDVRPFFPGATAAGDPYVGGFRASDGTLFLIAKGNGCVARVDTSTLTPVGCLPLGARDEGGWWHSDGDVTEEGPEMFVLSNQGGMYALPAGATAFEDITVEGARPGGRKSAVLWTGPDEAYFVGPLKIRIIRYADGVAALEPLALSELDALNGLGFGERLGPLAVTNLGTVAHRTAGEWRHLGASNVSEARFVVDVGSRIFVGGRGVVAEVGPNGEACPTALSFGEEVQRLVRTAPDRFAFTIHRGGGDPPELYFVRVLGPPPSTCN